LGYGSDSVQQVLHGLKCEIVINQNWAQGQGSSVAAGVTRLKSDIDAVLLLVADQPKISAKLILSLIETGKKKSEEIIIPSHKSRRGNPVLFKRSTFADLSELKADLGGKSIFSAHSLYFMEWQNPDEFEDIDAIEDYQGLLDDNEKTI